MGVVIADATFTDVAELIDCEFEVAFGSDENSIELKVDAKYAPPVNGYVYIDGTEYGGTIDEVKASTTRSGSRTITATGRSWHGILAGKRILADEGKAKYSTGAGPSFVALNAIIKRLDLTDIFEAPDNSEAVWIKPYSFDRFTDAYSGLKAMLDANSAKLVMSHENGKVALMARKVVDYGSKVDSDLLDFDITSVSRCTNHLVCGGTGEAEGRIIVHFFADKDGNVSHTQSLFGVDEITGFYDCSNADSTKLEEEGAKKLKELQGQGTVEVDVHDDLVLDVGDIVSARDNSTGLLVSAPITKKIVTFNCGITTYDYEAGTATTGTSNSTYSGGGESSGGGGHTYYAGDGISISNYAISADVTQTELDTVSATATQALTDASNASAAAGKAQTTADNATTVANTAQTTANQVATDLTEKAAVIKGTQTAATYNWTGVAPFSELKDGMQITYWLPYSCSGTAVSLPYYKDRAGTTVAGYNSGAALNLTLADGTQTGNVAVYYKSTTRATTHYAAGAPITLTYRKMVKFSGSCYVGWWASAAYFSDTVDNQISSFCGKTGAVGVWANALFMEDTNGTYQSLTTTGGTASTKTRNTNGFKLGATLYINVNKTYAASTNIAGTVYSSRGTGATAYYTINDAEDALTVYAPWYIVGTVQGGAFYLDEVWWTDTPNETGKVYILGGNVYRWNGSYHQYMLLENNPWYVYDGEKLVDFVWQVATDAQAIADAAWPKADLTSKPAAQGGTDLSLCTTGEKYAWNNNSSSYESKEAVEGGTEVSLCTTGEKYKWNSATGDYLPLSGGTLTGNLSIQKTGEQAKFSAVRTDFENTAVPSSTMYLGRYTANDNDGNAVGGIETWTNTSGNNTTCLEAIRRDANGDTLVNNYVRLYAGNSAATVAISHPDAWRDILFPWTVVKSWSGSAAQTFDLSNYTEVMIFCYYDTTYNGSTILRKQALHATTKREVLLPGGYTSGGGRYCSILLARNGTSNQILYIDGIEYSTSTSTKWYVYGR